MRSLSLMIFTLFLILFLSVTAFGRPLSVASIDLGGQNSPEPLELGPSKLFSTSLRPYPDDVQCRGYEGENKKTVHLLAQTWVVKVSQEHTSVVINVETSSQSIKTDPVIILFGNDYSKKKCFDHHTTNFEDLFIPGDAKMLNDGTYHFTIGNVSDKENDTDKGNDVEYNLYLDRD